MTNELTQDQKFKLQEYLGLSMSYLEDQEYYAKRFPDKFMPDFLEHNKQRIQEIEDFKCLLIDKLGL